MARPYVVQHLDLDGVVHGRESGYPMVRLALHPIGTELPAEAQTVELSIRIGDAESRLDRKALDQLGLWLAEHLLPRR